MGSPKIRIVETTVVGKYNKWNGFTTKQSCTSKCIAAATNPNETQYPQEGAPLIIAVNAVLRCFDLQKKHLKQGMAMECCMCGACAWRTL
jgi:hypothetical protein